MTRHPLSASVLPVAAGLLGLVGLVLVAGSASAAPGAATLWEQRIAQAERWRPWIAACAAALVALGGVLHGARRPALLARTRAALLLALAAATLAVWWHPYRGRLAAWLHVGDAYHYFIGAKYFDELGYTRLYECTLVADAEAGLAPQLRHSVFRHLATNRIVRAAPVLADPDACKQHFTPERWRAFQADLNWFRRRVDLGGWQRFRTDHGYNAPPTWTLQGHWLANLGPASRGLFLVLTALDPLLIAGMLGAVGWAFGWRTACVLGIFFGTNQFAKWEWVGGSVLRYDWLACALVALCCLRRRRPVAAGLLLAWSIALRMFPLAIAAGIAGALLWRLRRRGLRLEADERRFAVALAAGGAAALAISAVVVGPSAWLEFARNSRLHLQTDTVNRTGLRPVLAFDRDERLARTLEPRAKDPYAHWRELRAATHARRRVLHVVLAAAGCALVALALRGQPLWAAGVVGIGWIPLVLELGSYYLVVLAGYALLREAREDVAAALLALAAASWWIGDWDLEPDVLVWRTSIAILCYVTYASVRMLRPLVDPPPGARA